MLFKYKAHNVFGEMVKGEITSADRRSAILQLKKNKLSPISVFGINKKGSRFIFFTTSVLVIGAIFSYFYFMPGQKIIMPKLTEKDNDRAHGKRNQTGKLNFRNNKVPPNPTCSSHDAQRSLNKNSIKNGKYKTAAEFSLSAEIIHKTIHFKNATEQIIANLVSKRLGDMPPPLPNLPVSEDILDSINHVIEVYDDDSMVLIDLKESVANSKNELLQYMEEGGEPQYFLAYYHKILLQAHREWKKAQSEYNILEESNPKIADEYADEMDKALSQKGIKPIERSSSL